MLCMLVVVFGFDPIAGQGFFAGKSEIMLITLLCVSDRMG